MRDVAQTEAGTTAKWADAGWEYAYIAEGMDNHAQYQMKWAFGMGRATAAAATAVIIDGYNYILI
jgi:hypothetical protein